MIPADVLSDKTKTARQIGELYGVSASVVKTRRQRAGMLVGKTPTLDRFPPEPDPPWFRRCPRCNGFTWIQQGQDSWVRCCKTGLMPFEARSFSSARATHTSSAPMADAPCAAPTIQGGGVLAGARGAT